ncbi:MAG: DNA polymerase I [Propylenella sp.]
MKAGDHLILVDGSGFIFRAFHALPPLTRKSDSLPVGAVAGFCNMIWKMLQEGPTKEKGDEPTHFAVIFDYSAKTFRREIFADYKAHRPEPPSDLIPQFGLIRQATRAFNLACVEQEGWEADDLIATYAKQADAAGATVTIVSSDKDLMQLVRPGVSMVDTMKEQVIDREAVKEKFGVYPEKMIELQALVGDSTDNVPGVPGIGPKAAAQLLNEIGSLDHLVGDRADLPKLKEEISARFVAMQASLRNTWGLANANSAQQVGAVLAERFGFATKDGKGKFAAKAEDIERLAAEGNSFCQDVLRARALAKIASGQIDLIEQHREQARISRRLVVLSSDVPLDVPLNDLAVDPVDGPKAVAFCKAMEFNALMRRVAEKTGTDIDAVEPAALIVEGWPPGGGPPAHGPDMGVSERAQRAQQDAGKRSPRSDEPGSARLEGSLGAPKALAEARKAKALVTKFSVEKYQAVRRLADLERWMESARGRGLLAIDLETVGPGPMQAELCGIALAVEPGVAGYVPLGHRAGDGDIFGAGLEKDQIPLAEALQALKPVLEDPAILKIGHNIKNDWLVLARYGVETAPIDDTMLMSYALDAGATMHGHGIAALAKDHLAHERIALKDVAGSGRDKVAFHAVPIDKAAQYAAEGADIALRLWTVLKPRLPAERVTRVYERLERPLVQVLARMERRGIKVDRQILSRLSGSFAQKAGAVEAEIYEIAGKNFNIGSTKQLGDILFGEMGLSGGKKTRTGQWSTDVKVLDDLAEEGVPIAKKIVDWRQLTKLKSTYTDALPGYVHPETGRVHTDYALASTSTGRLSSSEPNLQNIPVRTEEGRAIRRAFIADKGFKLVSADYSQIELRVLAHMADIPQLVQAFADGLDIHAMTASEMFGVPVEGMDPMIRRRAKAINFGIIYGISAFGLAAQLGIPRGEAADYINRYFERFPGIRDYMDKTKASCREKGYVETLFGRKAHYPDIRASQPSLRAFNERASINAPIQGSAADIIRRAMVRMDDALEEAGLRHTHMLLQVHDELVFEAADAEVKKAIPVIRRVMEGAALPAVQLRVPLHVDARAADNWEEAH